MTQLKLDIVGGSAATARLEVSVRPLPSRDFFPGNSLADVWTINYLTHPPVPRPSQGYFADPSDQSVAFRCFLKDMEFMYKGERRAWVGACTVLRARRLLAGARQEGFTSSPRIWTGPRQSFTASLGRGSTKSLITVISTHAMMTLPQQTPWLEETVLTGSPDTGASILYQLSGAKWRPMLRVVAARRRM